ncbi:hypothetical protein EBX31_07780, partial [bacterium]|nr:hypothetical protein [bacterium]
MKKGLVLVGILSSVFLFENRAQETSQSPMEEGRGGRHNITQGAIFTEDFRQQEGVQELKNGILYKVEAAGKGKTPKTSDRVKVNYVGK